MPGEGGWTLGGKVVLVTGATSGLGKATALALAPLGPRLYVHGRDPVRTAETAAAIRQRTPEADVRALLADLTSQAGVARLAEAFLATGDPLHVLVNNAGAVFGVRRQVSADGLELTFALNHLAYFALTVRLLERLKAGAPARIVNVASDAYTMAKGRFDFDDYNAERRYSPLRQYGRSKLANILFTREGARRLAGHGVTVNAASPRGLTATGFAHNVHPLAKIVLKLWSPFCFTAEEGAGASIHLAASPAVDGMTGRFFVGTGEAALAPAATNDDDARRLWELSAALTGLHASLHE